MIMAWLIVPSDIVSAVITTISSRAVMVLELYAQEVLIELNSCDNLLELAKDVKLRYLDLRGINLLHSESLKAI
jgi:hypothetical protein